MKTKPIKLIRGAIYLINYPGNSQENSYIGKAICLSDFPGDPGEYGWFEFKMLEGMLEGMYVRG